jgi:hypothetical protein
MGCNKSQSSFVSICNRNGSSCPCARTHVRHEPDGDKQIEAGRLIVVK